MYWIKANWFLNGEGVFSPLTDPQIFANPGAVTYQVEIASSYNAACSKKSDLFILRPQPTLSITALNNLNFHHCQQLTLVANGILAGEGSVTWFKKASPSSNPVAIGIGNQISFSSEGAYFIHFSYSLDNGCVFVSPEHAVKIAPIVISLQNPRYCEGSSYYPDLVLSGLNDNEEPSVLWTLCDGSTYNGKNPEIWIPSTYGNCQATIRIGNQAIDGKCNVSISTLIVEGEFSCCAGLFGFNDYHATFSGRISDLRNSHPEIFDPHVSYKFAPGIYHITGNLIFDDNSCQVIPPGTHFVFDGTPVQGCAPESPCSTGVFAKVEGGRLIVEQRNLVIKGGTTFKGSCNNMWSGIYVNDASILNLGDWSNRTVIQDAFYGITNGEATVGAIYPNPKIGNVVGVDFVNCFNGIYLTRFGMQGTNFVRSWVNNKFMTTAANNLKQPLKAENFGEVEFITGYGCYLETTVAPGNWIFSNNEFENVNIGLVIKGFELNNTLAAPYSASWSGNKLTNIAKIGVDFKESEVPNNFFSGKQTFKSGGLNTLQKTNTNALYQFSEPKCVMFNNDVSGISSMFDFSGI